MNPLLPAVRWIADCEERPTTGIYAGMTYCRICGRAWGPSILSAHKPDCAGVVAQAALKAWAAYKMTRDPDVIAHISSMFNAFFEEDMTPRDEMVIGLTGDAIDRFLRGDPPEPIPLCGRCRLPADYPLHVDHCEHFTCNHPEAVKPDRWIGCHPFIEVVS